MLTLQTLESLPPLEIFQTGIFIDSKAPGDECIPLCLPISNRVVLWVAVRGEIADWCIYVENPHYQGTEFEFRSIEDVKRRGDKLFGEEYIKKLVPCTTEAFERYRR